MTILEETDVIVATWAFIKRSNLDDTFKIATTLLHDKEDLIHKTGGWMLRELGKRDRNRLKAPRGSQTHHAQNNATIQY